MATGAITPTVGLEARLDILLVYDIGEYEYYVLFCLYVLAFRGTVVRHQQFHKC